MEGATKIVLQLTSCNGEDRMVNLAEKFKSRVESSDDIVHASSSVFFCFATSAEHPLTMGEISYFWDEIQDFIEGHDIEWCCKTDTTLGDKVHFTCYSCPQK